MRAVGLILAAGLSSRMGEDKALLEYRGKTFLNHLACLALPRVEFVVAVLGHNAERIAESVAVLPRIRTVVNEGYRQGMLSSLQCGLDAIGTDADWILWMLVDHPEVRGRTLDVLLGTAAESDAPVVIPTYEGQRGHPIALSRRVAAELAALDPDASPHDVVRQHYGGADFVSVQDAGVLGDIDRPEDYEGLTTGGG